MLEVAWRPRAHLDRESIALYIGLECKSPRAALSTMQKVDAAIEKIRLFPDIGGHFRNENLAAKEYRTFHVNPYTVYYRFDENTVTIYRILHQRKTIDIYSLIDIEEDIDQPYD